jgi:hypothetical protein
VKIDGMTVHASVTLQRIIDACEREMSSLDNPGICINCGEDADGCEPDARQYQCEACGRRAVYGSGELAMSIF